MKKNIAIIVSSPMTLTSFLSNHIIKLSEDYNIIVFANFPEDYEYSNLLGVSEFVSVNIKRNIDILSDMMSLYKIFMKFRYYKFDCVHSITPKAGLISMIAAWSLGVPNRFHTFTGQVWVTKTGLFKYFLKFLDKLIFRLSTFSLVDSESQRQFLIKENVISDSNSLVLGLGSISGVNINKFKINNISRVMIRDKYKFSNDDLVLLFLGRLNYDKGIEELIDAFSKLSKQHDNVKLLLVGPNEGDYSQKNVKKLGIDNIYYVGSTTEPELYYSASDVFILPSHREGFGTVVLEASAAKIPSVVSNIYGLSDAVIDGETGLLHKSKDSNDLLNKINRVINDNELRFRLGNNAYKRVLDFYQEDFLSNQLSIFYKQKIKG